MILRRFMKHVADQNWFAVGLDVIVVIVGIFLGLQVQGWNEARLERVEEHQYLERLHDDISNSIRSNNGRLAFLNRQDSSSRIMLEDLARCQLEQGNEIVFANGLFVMGKNLAPTLFRNVINELNSAGKSTLLRSLELRNGLAEHEAYLDETIYVHRAISLRTMPHILKIDNKFSFNLSEPKVGDEEVTAEEIIFDFDTLCQDGEFSHSISLIKAYSYDALARLKIVIQQQQALLVIIDKELNKFE